MSRILRNLVSAFFSFSIIVLVFGSVVIVAQTSVTGAWKTEVKADKAHKIQLSME